jgi:hypothetical protein
MLISNDKAVINSEKRFSKRDITVTFVAKDEIVGRLEGLLSDELTSLRDERKKLLFEFVKKHEDEILDFVRKSPMRFTDWWLQPFFGGKDKIQGSIKSILSVQPTQVTEAIGGTPASLKKVQPDRYPIDIWVDIELEVVVLESDSLASFLKPRGVAEPESIDEKSPLTLRSWPIWDTTERRTTITRSIHVEATVLAEGVKHCKYEDLKLENVR